jgi:hypothetical protein
LLDCIEQGLQHEFDKWFGIGPLISLGQHAIVVVLPLPDHCSHGQVSQKRFPRSQDQGLPQSPHAAVAIGKGLDKDRIPAYIKYQNKPELILGAENETDKHFPKHRFPVGF